MPAEHERLTVVGVGLIGGSIALAARRTGLWGEVVGVARSQASLRRAEASAVCNRMTTDLAEAAGGASLVVVCTPVGVIAPTLLQAAPACPPGALLTDAGSTKAGVVAAVESELSKLEAPPAFVGSHPLAGDHRTGPEHAREDLLTGRRVVITPTPQSLPAAVDRVSAFWRALGADVVQMAPAEHDTAVARTSHVPHVLAAALAQATPGSTLPLTGAGWQDTTRVAAGDPALWRDILLANREEVLAGLGPLLAVVDDYRQALSEGDGDRILQLLQQGKQQRDAVGD
ncbi:MAG: prephenate dehydrogenase/arogenate dehydrogenase family protein [Planctomycetota bacterium]